MFLSPRHTVWARLPDLTGMTHDVHLYPMRAGHVTDSRHCWCQPEVTIEVGGPTTVHHRLAAN